MAKSKYSTPPIGERFGSRIVLGYSHATQGISGAGRSYRIHYWLCRCDCGLTGSVDARGLIRGRQSRCSRCVLRSMAESNQKHGKLGLPEYYTWQAAIQRCTNPNHKNFKNYGGRGIKVCRRWRESFEAFLADMGARPSNAHSIDRKDNEGNYSCGRCAECEINSWPSNCRWATNEEQHSNHRANVFLEFRGERLTVTQWAQRLGVDRELIRSRLRLGWAAELALTVPKLARGSGLSGKRIRRRQGH